MSSKPKKKSKDVFAVTLELHSSVINIFFARTEKQAKKLFSDLVAIWTKKQARESTTVRMYKTGYCENVYGVSPIMTKYFGDD